MSIRIEHENLEDLKGWGMNLEKIQEACTFCQAGTPFWHRPTNRPVCESCAKKHNVKELKTQMNNKPTADRAVEIIPF